MPPAELIAILILHQEQQSGSSWLLTVERRDTSSVAIEVELCLATDSFDFLIAAA